MISKVFQFYERSRSSYKVFEIEINPLLVTSSEVIVADAVIRKVT